MPPTWEQDLDIQYLSCTLRWCLDNFISIMLTFHLTMDRDVSFFLLLALESLTSCLGNKSASVLMFWTAMCTRPPRPQCEPRSLLQILGFLTCLSFQRHESHWKPSPEGWGEDGNPGDPTERGQAHCWGCGPQVWGGQSLKPEAHRCPVCPEGASVWSDSEHRRNQAILSSEILLPLVNGSYFDPARGSQAQSWSQPGTLGRIKTPLTLPTQRAGQKNLQQGEAGVGPVRKGRSGWPKPFGWNSLGTRGPVPLRVEPHWWTCSWSCPRENRANLPTEVLIFPYCVPA